MQTRACRIFQIPKINFEAKDYTDIINWNGTLTEPPLTMDLKRHELLNFINVHVPTASIFRFSSHTQAVERSVKSVS